MYSTDEREDRTMRIFRATRLAGLVALTALAASCEPATEPEVGSDFDADAALADYEAVEEVLTATGWESFQALAGRTPFGGTPATADAVSGGALAVAALGTPSGGDDGRAFALLLARRLHAATAADGPLMAPIISDTHRGATFVYDPESDDYVVDPEREGAPGTGVRFVIYDVDDAGLPIVEQEIGYADLVDEGDSSSEEVALHLTVVANEVTVLDYLTTLDGPANRGVLTVHGFLQGERDRLDFDIEAVAATAEERTTLDIAFDLRIDARDFSVTGSVHGVEEATEGEGDVDVTVRHRSHSLRVDAHGEDGQLEASVFLNGDLFATVSGDAESPTILGASGEPLTFAQSLVLWHVIDTVEDVFDLLEDLVDPVDELVILGIIL
jgi:hypothetical protein